MWLLTPFGFFSVVEKAGDRLAGKLTLRARVREDLDQLRQGYLPELGEIIAGRGSDYRYRAQAPRAAVAAAMGRIIEALDYDNFKNAVAHTQGSARAHLYHDVWHALLGLNRLDTSTTRKPDAVTIPQAQAYGGVLIDDAGQILLREPANHFDGYVWTFAKGKRDTADTPEATVLREVREETGYHAEIVAALPKAYAGGTGKTGYYLMRPVGAPGTFDKETQSILWLDFDAAAELIAQTVNLVGRSRDLQVLADARALYAQLRGR